jgi:hypothetical protein
MVSCSGQRMDEWVVQTVLYVRSLVFRRAVTRLGLAGSGCEDFGIGREWVEFCIVGFKCRHFGCSEGGGTLNLAAVVLDTISVYL